MNTTSEWNPDFLKKRFAIFMRFGSILQNPHVEKVGIVMNSKIELEGLSSNQPYIAIHVILIPTKKMQHAFQRFIDFIAGWWWGSKVLLSRLHSAFVCVTEGPLIHLEPQMFAPTPWVHTQQAKRRSCRLPILHQRIQVPKMEGCLNLKWGCFGGGGFTYINLTYSLRRWLPPL